MQIPTICLLADDLAENVEAMRRSAFISAFTRLRHIFCHTLLLVQKAKVLAPIIRTNVTHWLIWRLRSEEEKKMMLQDISGHYGYALTEDIYELCTREPYSFMYYNGMASPPEFYCRFEFKVVVT